jgi:hypothetical protein
VKVVAFAIVLSLAPAARAADTLDAGFRMGYAIPFGKFEQGTRVRDLSYGTGLFALDATYALLPGAKLGLLFAYGVAIPKLCESASDCKSSLGSDVELAMLARFDLPVLGPVHPSLEGGAGYAWYTRRLSDADVESSRGYRGPFALVGGEAALGFAKTWRIGLAIDLFAGIVTSTKLEAPGVSHHESADGPTVSGSVFIGPRLSNRW